MSDISMTNNYNNNQSMINCKSNFKTPTNTRKLWRIFCHDCNLYTKSIEPIIIRRYNIQSFGIFATCDKCKTFKTIGLKDLYYEKFPRDYFNLPLGKPFMNTIITNKGEKRNILKDLFFIINEQFSEHD